MGSIGSRSVTATVVSALACVAILGAVAWMLLGNDDAGPKDGTDVQIIPPVDSATSGNSSGLDLPDHTRPDPTRGVETPAPVQVTVYVTGEVANMGMYTVAEGQRLSHVIDLAGGPTENADLDRINLAAYVSDATHYRIPARGETDAGPVDTAVVAPVSSGTGPGTGEGTSEPGSVAACAVPMNINTATAECLETLPGIGGVRAQSIVSHREQAGPFAAAAGITAVSGIGDGIYGQIADLITVGNR